MKRRNAVLVLGALALTLWLTLWFAVPARAGWWCDFSDKHPSCSWCSWACSLSWLMEFSDP